MLSIEKYLELTFEVLRKRAQLEEIERFRPYFGSTLYIDNRQEQLHKEIERIIAKLDKSAKPIELAPYEQYIDVLHIPAE